MKNLINNFIQSGAGEWLACILYGAFWVLVALLLAGAGASLADWMLY